MPAGESRGSAWGQHWALGWEAGLSVHLQIHFSSICAEVLSGLNASTERARARAVNFVNKLLRSESTDAWTSQSSVSGSYFNSSIQEYVYPRNLIINQALMQNISTYLVWLKHTAHQPPSSRQGPPLSSLAFPYLLPVTEGTCPPGTRFH